MSAAPVYFTPSSCATSRSAAVKARAMVGEKVAAEAEIRFMMVDQDFE